MFDQDLILTADKDGIAHITQDNFRNTYDRVGGPCSNYKPQRAFSLRRGASLTSPADGFTCLVIKGKERL
jgi:hypothetical protein